MIKATDAAVFNVNALCQCSSHADDSVPVDGRTVVLVADQWTEGAEARETVKGEIGLIKLNVG